MAAHNKICAEAMIPSILVKFKDQRGRRTYMIHVSNKQPSLFSLPFFIIFPYQWVYAKERKPPKNKNKNESDHNILTSCFIINEINTRQCFPLISSHVFLKLMCEEWLGVFIFLIHLLFRWCGF